MVNKRPFREKRNGVTGDAGRAWEEFGDRASRRTRAGRGNRPSCLRLPVGSASGGSRRVPGRRKGGGDGAALLACAPGHMAAQALLTGLQGCWAARAAFPQGLPGAGTAHCPPLREGQDRAPSQGRAPRAVTPRFPSGPARCCDGPQAAL